MLQLIIYYEASDSIYIYVTYLLKFESDTLRAKPNVAQCDPIGYKRTT
jgi:hypothetical protein